MLVEVLYLGAAGCLVLFGLHRLCLLISSFFARDCSTEAREPSGDELPMVTVQLPIYNESFVVEELLRCAANFDYPPERFEIQVLDDSDDGSTDATRRLIEELKSSGIDIRHLRRNKRDGFKAGALAYGLSLAKGDLLAIFDADFLPPPRVLRDVVPEFRDPKVGLVQARWGHLNRSASLLTRTQALQLDGHFLVEHSGRQRMGFLLNFNGTAGILRREAIEEAGGWQWETLTEDLDLSCRIQMKGWRIRYRPAIVVPAQLPQALSAYKAQQRRWTRGSIQTARKLLRPLWKSPLSLAQKMETSAFLLGNCTYLLLVAFAFLHGVIWAGRTSAPPDYIRFLDTYMLGLATLVLWVFYGTGSHRSGRGLLAPLLEVPALIAVGAGMSLNNSGAVLRGMMPGTGTFERTPKLQSSGAKKVNTTLPAVLPLAANYRAKLGFSIWLELPLAVASLLCSWLFFFKDWYGSSAFYLLYGLGLSYIGIASLWERWKPVSPTADHDKRKWGSPFSRGGRPGERLIRRTAADGRPPMGAEPNPQKRESGKLLSSLKD